MKKLLALLLAIVMLFTLAACSGSDDDDDDDDDRKSSSKKKNEEKLDFEEVVLVDTDEYTVTITDIDPDGDWGYTFHARFENNTDIDVEFTIDDSYINDIECNPFFYTEVPAGETAKEEIAFYEEDFALCEIEDVTKFEFIMRIYDSEDWSEPLYEEDFTIFPMGEDAAISQSREPKKGDIVLVDNEFGSITATGIDPDYVMGYAVHVYVENNSDMELYFNVDNALVNGEPIDPFWGRIIPAGKRVYTTMYWSEENLEEYDIDLKDINEIDLEIQLTDWESFVELAVVEATIEP